MKQNTPFHHMGFQNLLGLHLDYMWPSASHLPCYKQFSYPEK
jgi:hypothetical protein